MPVGIQRLNAKPQPNSCIVFIKALPGSTSQYATDFLERVAAICHPIMKNHHLSLMTLEEYEPNAEFVGRNFNGGEIIQLVLRSYVTGQWLPFRTVQMVMMHELAHCVQMNHSRAFWKVRNAYACELKELWIKGYTGDGLWGRGRTLLSGQYATRESVDPGELPQTLCGGMYRSRRKRRRKNGADASALTYAEKKQRRIEKKFGKNGVSLGDDEETRMKLEDGKRTKAKPRVAGSKRGRELRAAAALARFEQQNAEILKDESESEAEEDEDEEEYVDVNGKKLFDARGHAMIKVCEDEDASNNDVKQELEELCGVCVKEPQHTKDTIESASSKLPDKSKSSVEQRQGTNKIESTSCITCPICSLDNEYRSITCIACAHVLRPHLFSNTWQCRNPQCANKKYINAGDCGLCGLCGAKKSS